MRNFLLRRSGTRWLHWSTVLKSVGPTGRRACISALDWAATQPDLRTAWKRCKRADWLAWLVYVGGVQWPTRDRDLRLLATDLAERVIHLIRDDWERSIAEATIEVARRFAIGDATEKEVDAAYNVVCEARVPVAAYALTGIVDAVVLAADNDDRRVQVDLVRAVVPYSAVARMLRASRMMW